MDDIYYFAECLKSKLEKKLKEGFVLSIYTKESDPEPGKVGLILEQKGKKAVPFLDLNDAFSEYNQGKSLEEAADELRATIVSCEENFIWDWEKEE